MGEAMRILVTGAGGFIGHHLVKRLVADGHWVRGVDLHYPLFEPTPAQHFLRDDLREPQACVRACRTIDRVYDLAADMGRLVAQGVAFTQVDEERWGTVTRFTLPGGTTIGLYQPKHPTAHQRN